MATLVWDDVGTRFYENGVDRGVLYLPDAIGVPWNGLISVNEKTVGNELSSFHFDGVKYIDIASGGDFSATLRAYTYPDEFLECEGVVELNNGLFATNQRPKRFGLSYRTRVSNDLKEDTYKIHVLYNLTAIPNQKNYQTIGEVEDAMEFEWTINAVPGAIHGAEPTAHLIFDTRLMSPTMLKDLEDLLYGTGVIDSRLPDITTLASFIDSWVILRITDNLDGTWTAEGPDEYFTMLDATTFQIDRANAEYLDADTYYISSITF